MGKSKKKEPIFGTPEYLVEKFNDISSAKYSKGSKAAKSFTELVKSLSTKKDDMRVCEVISVEGACYDGKNQKGVVAHVCIGLNGSGRQSDYFDAIKRLVSNKTTKVTVFDAWIDVIDDLMDVLVRIG